MLHVTDLVFDYPDKRLLQDVSFSVKKGIALHVKGENGAGKTTLLKLLAGLLHPLSGKISFGDQLCYVGHQHGVNMRLTPSEHMRFDLGVTDEKLLIKLLTRLNLQDICDMPSGLLSAGQKRRVGLLRLLVAKAELWLLDEPLVGLDDAGMQVLTDLIKQHLNQNGSIVLTSHQALPFGLDVNVLKELNL
ncbi:MAG: heme ABC exporter ATP-binding protein CcmA [Gammaproteobacteria bacterium]|nr:heme ABC exporter ATP-binding protein CcmA [Gammaproteobacteria bacterium]